jgi:putative flippase GtrA
MKKGINTFQRLMNVVFIAWALWFLFVLTLLAFGLVKLNRGSGIDFLSFIIIPFLGWLLVIAVNYIVSKKATVWHSNK